jgi:hypothetical protein
VANFITLPCPECEGVGKQVDFFTIPEPPDLTGHRIKFRLEPDEPRTQDGRAYLDQACRVCNGTTVVTLHFPPGVKREDLVVVNGRWGYVVRGPTAHLT